MTHERNLEEELQNSKDVNKRLKRKASKADFFQEKAKAIEEERKKLIATSNYDWYAFGLGAAGSISTVVWYAGLSTAAVAGFPVLTAGVVLSAASVYLVSPENMTTQDKVVLGSVVAATHMVGLGVVAHSGAWAVAGLTVGTGAYLSDEHKIVVQTSPATAGMLVGIVGGGVVATWICAQDQKLNRALNEAERLSLFDNNKGNGMVPIRGVNADDYFQGDNGFYHVPKYMTAREIATMRSKMTVQQGAFFKGGANTVEAGESYVPEAYASAQQWGLPGALAAGSDSDETST
jgi:hypothetical protein